MGWHLGLLERRRPDGLWRRRILPAGPDWRVPADSRGHLAAHGEVRCSGESLLPHSALAQVGAAAGCNRRIATGRRCGARKNAGAGCPSHELSFRRRIPLPAAEPGEPACVRADVVGRTDYVPLLARNSGPNLKLRVEPPNPDGLEGPHSAAGGSGSGDSWLAAAARPTGVRYKCRRQRQRPSQPFRELAGCLLGGLRGRAAEGAQ